MIRHTKDVGNEPNPKRFELLQQTYITMKKDGLNNLNYNVSSIACCNRIKSSFAKKCLNWLIVNFSFFLFNFGKTALLTPW